MIPTLELVSLVIDVVYLRQAGIARTQVEDRLVQERQIPRHAARRLIGQVEHELQGVRHRMSLPLALSAEALLCDCVVTQSRPVPRN